MIDRIIWYGLYWWRSSNLHGLHSPFLYELRTQWWLDRKFYADFDQLDAFKQELYKDQRRIEITDFGAGSTINKSNVRSIASLAKNSSKSNRLHHFIYRLFNEMNPQTILELGTSLGITSSYIAKSCPSSNLITFEGCGQTAKEAMNHFKKLGIDNVDLVLGNIDTTLAEQLLKIPCVDAAFLDGNHTYEATVAYFKAIEPKLSSKAFVVVDDIYWSKGMKKAWEQLKTHTKVTTSVDLFHMGILFFNPDLPNQSVAVR